MQLTMQGEVKADGTLELDSKVFLPAGRVLVTVQPVVPPDADDPLWQLMERIWAGQRARGHVPRTREQVDAELRALDEDADLEMQANERLHAEGQHAREATALGRMRTP